MQKMEVIYCRIVRLAGSANAYLHACVQCEMDDMTLINMAYSSLIDMAYSSVVGPSLRISCVFINFDCRRVRQYLHVCKFIMFMK